MGLVATLNRGLNLSTGEYIARMDCDDISLPNRLIEQVNFMNTHPKVAYCGSWTKTIGGQKSLINSYPATDDELRARLLFSTPFAHPSVIVRRQTVSQNHLEYDENYRHAEDYEFWSRAINFGQMANLQKVLLLHRIHERSVSSVYAETQKANADKVRLNLIEKLGLIPTEKELMIHAAFTPLPCFKDGEFLMQLEHWLRKIQTANNRSKIYKQSSLFKIISERWLASCSANARGGMKIWKKFWTSPLSKGVAKNNRKDIVKFLIKCLLGKNNFN
jgi:glycosyltransferase involved in cell wall biosynthesis